MNWYFKWRLEPGDALREAFQKDMREHKLNLHISQEKSHTLKIKELPADRLLKALKKWPTDKTKNSF